MFNVDKLNLYESPLLDELEKTPRHLDAIISDFVSPLDEEKIFEHQSKKISSSSLDSFLVGRKG